MKWKCWLRLRLGFLTGIQGALSRFSCLGEHILDIYFINSTFWSAYRMLEFEVQQIMCWCAEVSSARLTTIDYYKNILKQALPNGLGPFKKRNASWYVKETVGGSLCFPFLVVQQPTLCPLAIRPSESIDSLSDSYRRIFESINQLSFQAFPTYFWNQAQRVENYGRFANRSSKGQNPLWVWNPKKRRFLRCLTK